MNNLSIKNKLLIYNLLAQIVILVIFSIGLYEALESSALENIKSKLKVIILDISHDIKDYNNPLTEFTIHEEKEYKIKPLYIRIFDMTNQKRILKTHNFPLTFNDEIEKLKSIKIGQVEFEQIDEQILSRIKIIIYEKIYIIELATTNQVITDNLENLLYSFILIIPIILFLLFSVGYLIIRRAFLPIQNMQKTLKNITTNDLTKRLDISGNKNDEIDALSSEINNLLVRLETSFNKISQFSADASHELKTPLTIIRGEIDIALRKDRDNEYYKKTLESSLDEVLIIQNTIDDLLFLAKSQHNIEKYKNDIYLDEITQEAITELNKYAKLESIVINFTLLEHITIKGDANLVKIALKNIIKNAITYSYTNSIINIKNYIHNGKKIIEIEDYGIGIDPTEQEKIFEKFYRADKSRDKHSGGTGLGMSIVKEIIDMHKGKILIKSAENKGTNVTIEF